jgi:hypothetical protein
MKTVSLIGGSWDGLQVQVESWRKVFTMAKTLSIEETQNLQIDGAIAWRSPEENYERKEDGNFHYRNTVTFKP